MSHFYPFFLPFLWVVVVGFPKPFFLRCSCLDRKLQQHTGNGVRVVVPSLLCHVENLGHHRPGPTWQLAATHKTKHGGISDMVKKRQRKHFIFVFCFFVFCCNKVRLGKAFLQSWKALPCPICKEHCICGMGTATVDACTMCQMLNACAKQFILLLLQTLF